MDDNIKLEGSNVLIVDDAPENLLMLKFILKEDNYNLSTASNGDETFRIIEENKPELILLDIMLPDIDGYEICSRIKADEYLRDITIIFVTALTSESDKVRGFQLGAVDYITKPFFHEEIQMRVRTHLRLKKYADHMNELVENKTKEVHEIVDKMSEYKKMATMAGLLAGIFHDIETPLGITLTSITHLEDKKTDLDNMINSNSAKLDNYKELYNTVEKVLNIVPSNIRRTHDIIKSFKEVTVDQASNDKRVFNVREYIDDIILSLHPRLKKYNHKIKVECPKSLVIDSNPGAFAQIITNFIMNSIIHGFKDRVSGNILISVSIHNENLRIEYSDNGVGIPKNVQDKVFDIYFTTKKNEGGSGLGLNIIKNLVVQNLSGNIELKSSTGNGTQFTISYPVKVASI